MKITTTLLLLIALCLSSAAQVKTKPRTPRPKTQPVVLSRVSLEVGFVYTSGDVKPVARERFYLLGSDLGQALFNAGLKSPADARPADAGSEQEQLINSFAMAVQNQSSSMERLEFYRASQKIFPACVVASAETDFTGKAAFEQVKSGKYFIFGITKTRKGFAVWHYRIEVTASDASVILDQHNANYAE